MDKVYTIKLTPAGIDYLRAVLGRQPYDECGPMIASLMQQRAEQDRPPEPADPAPAAPATPAALNGAASAAQH